MGEGCAMKKWFWLAVGAMLGWGMLVNAFVSVTHAKKILESGQEIHWTFEAPLYGSLALGLALDFTFNVTAGTIIFHELPEELLFTARLKRHLSDTGRSGARAKWWCAELDKFEEGHC